MNVMYSWVAMSSNWNRYRETKNIPKILYSIYEKFSGFLAEPLVIVLVSRCLTYANWKMISRIAEKILWFKFLGITNLNREPKYFVIALFVFYNNLFFDDKVLSLALKLWRRFQLDFYRLMILKVGRLCRRGPKISYFSESRWNLRHGMGFSKYFHCLSFYGAKY